MKILLINPSWGSRIERQRYNRAWPPLDLLYAASGLKSAGFEVALCDARATGATPHSVTRQVQDACLVVVNTSPLDRWQCPNLDLNPLLQWTAMVPPEKLILCGVHGTLFPQALLDLTGARIVVRGEPEHTVPVLCKTIAGTGRSLTGIPSISYRNERRIVHNPPAGPVDLAALPLPAYDLAFAENYEYELLGKRMAILETGRGCPHSCTFCLKEMYGSRARFKPMARIIEEVRQVRALGYECVYFMDLELCLDRKRTLELCAVMRDSDLSWCCQTRVDDVDPELLRQMAGSGCRLIHYGLETGGPETLRRIGKNVSTAQIEKAVRWTASAGISTAGFFLLGFPWEGPEDWLQTEKFARKLKLTYASFHRVTPYPCNGSGDASSGAVPWWELHPEQSGSVTIPDSRLRRIYLRYYLRPAYLARFLRGGANRLGAARLFISFLRSPSGMVRKHSARSRVKGHHE